MVEIMKNGISTEKVDSVLQGECPYTKLACPDDCMLDNKNKCNCYLQAMADLKDYEESIKAGLVI